MNAKRKTTLLYFFAFTSLGLIAGALGPSIPKFAENTLSSLRQVSALFIFSSLGFLSGSFLAGLFLNRFPGHRLISLLLVTMSVGVALLPVVNHLWLLVALLFIIGIAQGHLAVGENTLLMWLHGEKVTPFMNGLHFFFGLGSFLAPLFIAQSLRFTQNLNLAYWIMAALILLPAPFLARISSPDISKANEYGGKPRRTPPTWIVVLLITFFFAYAGAEVTYGNWLYTYSINQGFTNAQTAAYLTSLFWGTFTFARLMGVFLSRKLAIKTMLLIDLSGSLLSMLLIFFWIDKPAFLWVGTLGFGLFMASTFPTAMNLAEKIGAVSSRATGAVFVASSLGTMISPWLVGQWFETTGPQVTIWAILANLLLAFLLFTPLFRYNHEKQAVGS